MPAVCPLVLLVVLWATPASGQTADRVVASAVALLPEDVRSTLPEIDLVALPSAWPEAQAYAERGRIYVNANAQTYRGAQAGNKNAVKLLASIIAHERAHALHNATEAEAYAVQIETLKALRAPKDFVKAVEQALDLAREAS